MLTYTHIINDPLGLHARPAGLLVKEAQSYKCDITVSSSSGAADCKRLIAVMHLSAKEGMELLFRFNGEDEKAACEGIKNFLAEKL